MKIGADTSDVIQNCRSFLGQLDIPLEQKTLLQVTYDGEDYLRYQTLTEHRSLVVADALATKEKNHAMFLPLADCTGAVLYDPENNVLLLSHLGRHSVEQFGGERSVAYLQQQFASDPAKLSVWLSPSPNGTDYPLWQFQNRSFRDVIVEQLIKSGVIADNIEASDIDTIRSKDYFSHSEFLKGNRANDGRYAIVAMLR